MFSDTFLCVSITRQQKDAFIFRRLMKKHKNILKHTKSFRGRSKNCFRVAIRRLQKSWQYAYRDRRRKRREWSKFWIQRIQAGVRQYSWRYSRFMGCYKRSGMKLDRKVSSPFLLVKSYIICERYQTCIYLPLKYSQQSRRSQ